MDTPIRVLVVDDDFHVAHAHAVGVSRVPGFDVVGEAHSCAEALAAVAMRRSTCSCSTCTCPTGVASTSSVSWRPIPPPPAGNRTSCPSRQPVTSTPCGPRCSSGRSTTW